MATNNVAMPPLLSHAECCGIRKTQACSHGRFFARAAGISMVRPQAPDGQVYAIAQGPAVVGGYVAGGSGNSQVVNHPTVGRLPNGAIVERPSPSAKIAGDFRLQLR